MKFFGHVMRKEGWENWTLPGHIEGKKKQGKVMGHVPDELV